MQRFLFPSLARRRCWLTAPFPSACTHVLFRFSKLLDIEPANSRRLPKRLPKHGCRTCTAPPLLTFSLNDTRLAFIVAPLFGLLLHFFPPYFSALNGVEFQDTSTEILQTYLSQSQLAASACLAVTHISIMSSRIIALFAWKYIQVVVTRQGFNSQTRFCIKSALLSCTIWNLFLLLFG